MTSRQISLTDEAATNRFASAVAALLRPGDTILLQGPIGAGKSAFARGVIRARLGRMEDVPSPTFTLVQTYEAPDGDIWHCDLYRLTHPDEVLELGLEEAFQNAICLIEWPDRLGPDTPDHALTLTFAARADDHLVTFDAPPAWQNRLTDLHV
ncbi:MULTISPECIES: tRNA (adenosine(37)-N6)-threonylcarbamoyltransferase complex ATPase subunit type 1 TsaE [unclassified Yoonia]|uniref:tRNA (adenosine(37)-N6)-threonylcarbamoyltransferase complex ATPase subunit type 1 TsaE n=1 Tax=unclassified Yoonia TaxID=2629118 RepID=UPI002AFE47AE|nr:MULTISPECIES: tRNA (adenosine(37)-N6)-threonylcarbamoyltransferase complex ATPase subunit type 1 TsaE [unclassified Yoonia]